MIREWRAEDTPAVAAIERESFSDPWSEEMLSASLCNPVFHGFVYEENGEAAGYVGVMITDAAEIALIAVRPDKRRKGVGGQLLSAALSFARAEGCDNVFLEVRVGNVPAKTLYEKFGFLPVYVRKRYYSDGEDALVMVLPVKKQTFAAEYG